MVESEAATKRQVPATATPTLGTADPQAHTTSEPRVAKTLPFPRGDYVQGDRCGPAGDDFVYARLTSTGFGSEDGEAKTESVETLGPGRYRVVEVLEDENGGKLRDVSEYQSLSPRSFSVTGKDSDGNTYSTKYTLCDPKG